jgi:dihydrofolate reductase
MSATYTFDVFSTLDGCASYDDADWGPYWGKAGPRFLEHREATTREEQRLVLGAGTFRQFQALLGGLDEAELDATNLRLKTMPTTVVSSTIAEPVDWPDATIETGDAVAIVTRLKETSAVPLRSHGSLSLNRALLAAGLVDRVQVTIFPVIAGRTGVEPILAGETDFDLELLESRTFDGQVQELVYRPTLHR